MSNNPYAAPKAAVADVAQPSAEGDFIAEGQGVGTGRGWDWIVEGWNLFRRQPGMWILLLIILLGINIVLGFIPIVGDIVSGLLYQVFGAGLVLGCHALWRDEPLEIGHLFAGFKNNFGRLVGLAVVTILLSIAIVLVAFLIVGFGSIGVLMSGEMPELPPITIVLAVLIALALLLPLYMAMWFAPALIVINDFKIFQALKTSFFGCLKNILPFLIYGVILFVFLVIAAIPFGLGLIIMFPVMIASIYASYRDIFYSA